MASSLISGDDASEDTRNLRSDLKGLSVDQVRETLERNRFNLQIAIENLEHDFNIGSIVRSSNAFNVKAIHIIGARRWNKRGAMKTDAYMHIYHHYSVAEFGAWASGDDTLRDELRLRAMQEDPRNTEHTAEKAPIPSALPLVIGIDCLEGISTPIEHEKLPENAVLLFGSEQSGLSDDAQRLAKQSSGKILHITQYGSTRSINAGHAASIAMFKWVTDLHS